jgi:ankyrin repeat protein
MTEFMKGAARAGFAALAAAALTLPGVAPAQFQSPTSQFLKAVRDADGAKATELLNEPGSTIIDARDLASGQGALHIVVARRDLSWLGFLLARKPRVDAKDKQGTTPLLVAAQLGFAEGAAALIQARARVDEPNNQGETPLIRAVQLRDIRMVRMLLDAGANADRADTLAGMSAREYAKRDARGAAVLKAIDDAAKKAKPAAIGPK